MTTTVRRDYWGGNALGTLPDGVTTRQSRDGGTMTVQVIGRDVRYLFDAVEAKLRGLDTTTEEALS
jgi:hypothetical protein